MRTSLRVAGDEPRRLALSAVGAGDAVEQVHDLGTRGDVGGAHVLFDLRGTLGTNQHNKNFKTQKHPTNNKNNHTNTTYHDNDDAMVAPIRP